MRRVAPMLLAGVLGSCAPAFSFPEFEPESSAAPITVVKQLGWGTPEAFEAARPRLEHRWPQLDWESNGCSAPEGLGLGYRELFAPACAVHDFAYHNLRVLEPTAENRRASDLAFHTNLKSICTRQRLVAQPACLSAAAAYYAAVRLRGATHFAAGT